MSAGSRKNLNTSQIGDIGESKFMFEAIKRGFTIGKPFGNNLGFDVFLYNGATVFRVQVKTSLKPKEGNAETYGQSYDTLAGLRKHSDVIACYSAQRDCFYIIPVNRLKYGRIRISSGVSKWDKYKENWSVFEPNRLLSTNFYTTV